MIQLLQYDQQNAHNSLKLQYNLIRSLLRGLKYISVLTNCVLLLGAS